MDNNTHRDTIGLLYPGEMGSSFGRLLSEHGLTVLTTTANRSPRTQRLCHEAGLVVAGSVREVVQQSDLIVSFITPAAAYALAAEVADLARRSFRTLLFMDANSISPETALSIDALMRTAHVDFVDAAVHGLASNLRQRGVLFTSGPRAAEVEHLFGSAVRVWIVGNRPGQASALKMAAAGISKGIVGLFVETMLLACEMGLLEQILDVCNDFYPGLMEALERLLPTYPQHAGRRLEELRELESTMTANGIRPNVVRGVRDVISDLAAVGWHCDGDRRQWTIVQIIKELHRHRIPAAVSAQTGWNRDSPHH